jgi:hypothetical protein
MANEGVPGQPGGGAPALPGGIGGQGTATPVWVLDDSAEPGKEYQYRLRLQVYNPAYRFPHDLEKAEAKLKEAPTLVGEWAMVPNPVTVEPSTYFFVMGGIGGIGPAGNSIGAQIYKWSAGHWTLTESRAQAGLQLAGGKNSEVTTGHTVIDVVPNGNTGNVTVVLQDLNGELVTRESADDQKDPKRRELFIAAQASLPVRTPKTPTGPTPGGPGMGPGMGPGKGPNPPSGPGPRQPGGPFDDNIPPTR